MVLKLSKEKKDATIKDKLKILENLNENQSSAVKTTEGPLLVIAGAGSGKTRVLTFRTAYLIANGVPPWKILALTFTNKAAGEMVERIAKIVPPDAAEKVWAGTFHSIFAKILRFEADKTGYSSNYTIYDTDDSLRTIRRSMENLGISQKEYPAQGMRSRISNSKNKMIGWERYRSTAEDEGNILEKQTGLVFEEYEKQLRSANAMDFDDLLINMIYLLRNSPETLLKYREKFSYILVDEYQDTNRAQYLAVNLLAGGHKNICVVGDDAQSIYKWRGADIRNILDFQNDYPEATLIRLEQNYRSTKVILDAASDVIKNNRRQIPKKLWTENKVGEKITLLESVDDRSEADKIASRIMNLIKKGKKKNDIAVLYRTNAQSLNLENSLRSKKLPYVIIGGTSFYKRKEIKDALAYFRLMLNPKDNDALLRIVNEPPRGLGKVSLNHISDFAGRNGLQLLEAFSQAEEIDALKPKAKMSAIGFYKLIKKYINSIYSMPPAELAGLFIEETGLPDMYKEIGTEDANDRWNNIQQLLTDINQFFISEDDSSFDDYLQQISLVSEVDEADTSQDKITLMTLHSAKGLEYPVVFIAGLEQGLFPLAKAEFSQEEEEEERRLFYVGITRAKEKLYLSYAMRRMRFGETVFQSPSVFISEIDKDLIETEKRTEKPLIQITEKKKSRPSWSAQKKEKPPVKTFDFRVGDRVSHNHFGVGKITGLYGTGEKRQAVVFFPPYGKKKLMLQYAKLVKVK